VCEIINMIYGHVAYCQKCQWAMEQLAAKCPACGYEPPAGHSESVVQYTLRDLLVLFTGVAILLTLWNAARKPYQPMFQAHFSPTRVQYLPGETVVDGVLRENGGSSERQMTGRVAARLGFADFSELTEIVVRSPDIAAQIEPHLRELATNGSLKSLGHLSLPRYQGADQAVKELQVDLPNCQIEIRRGRPPASLTPRSGRSGRRGSQPGTAVPIP
jgi:hypothetical protein